MSWTYTNPDDGEQFEVYSTSDGDQAVFEPRFEGDPEPYCATGTTGRRYRPGQVEL